VFVGPIGKKSPYGVLPWIRANVLKELIIYGGYGLYPNYV
jgi:hypothetical protein